MARGQSGAGGYGKGVPSYFICPVARRDRDFLTWALPSGHSQIVRTGRTRPYRGHGSRHPRMLDTAHEYRCECGHVGWSAHRGVLYHPVEEKSE